MVAATDLSRRPLEKAFRNEMKRSLNEEVVRLRIAQVKKLLTTTRLKVVEVAARTGFSRPSHLFRTFRKLVGMSPKIWRNRQAAGLQPPAAPRSRRRTEERR